MSTFQQAIQSHIDKFEDNLFTSLPATVLSFDSKQQTATVVPVMYEAFPDGVSMALPKIENVPVMFSGAGGGVLTFPIRTGDPVLLVISSRNFDTWWNSSKTPSTDVSQSTTQRFNDFNDAIAIVGLNSKKDSVNASTENVELKFATSTKDLLSNIKLLPDKGVEIISQVGSSVKLNANKSIEVLSGTGSSVHLLPDGNIEITTKGTIKIQNEEEELISLLSELMELLADTGTTTTNTQLGPMPLNSAGEIAAIKSRLDTLKG